MKRYFFLILFSYNGLICQNYKPFNFIDTIYYRPEFPFQIEEYMSEYHYANYIISAMLDSSINEGNKTKSYFYRTINKNNTSNCFYINQNHWFGSKYIDLNNGDFLFFNYNNDSIILKTTVSPNISWNAFNYNDSTILEAKIISVQNESFYNLTDSVKTYELTHKDMQGNIINDSINSVQLKISKNYGFLNLFSFNCFPDSIQKFEINGIQHFSEGNYIPTIREIYNFNIGDTLQYDYQSVSGNPLVYDQMPYQESRIILSMNYYNDSLIYSYHRMRYLWGNLNINDTVYQTINNLDSLVTSVENQNVMPMQTQIVLSEKASLYSMYDNDYNMHLALKFPEMFIEKDNMSLDTNCYSYFIPRKNIKLSESGIGQYFKYIKGLGIERNIKMCNDFMYPIYGCYPCEELIYFHKGGEIWGSRIITNESEIETQKNIFTVYPNPTSEFMNINSNIQIKNIVLFDLLGNEVTEKKEINSRDFVFNVSKLNPDLYFVQIEFIDGEIATKKIMIK